MAHPALRILSFLVWIVLLSRLGPIPLLAATVVIVATCLMLPGLSTAPAFTLLYRARWLFLALLVVYLGFTPGVPLIEGLGLPSREGLLAGARRVLALGTVILSVSVLLQSTPRRQLVAGLQGLLHPFACFAPELLRLAPRLVLVLDAAAEIRRDRPELAAGSQPGSWLDRVAGTLAVHYETALTRARRQAPLTMELEARPAPAIVDYLVPVLLLAACFFL
jgi:hypothetical protein